MPEITMTEDHTYSPNGVDLSRLSKGDRVDVDEATAERLVARGVAEQKPAPKKAEDAPAEENKAEDAPAEENKSGRRSRKAS